jgi:tRNA dimethylallyltransferase
MASELIFIIGGTACGKSAVGLELARRLEAEIVACDSMKVYRRMDIGTAKPSAAQQREIRHHLIDVVEPSDSFSAAAYVELADRAIAEIRGRGRPVVVVGGTALYLMGLARGLFEGPGQDPEFRRRLRERVAREGAEAVHAELRAVDPDAAGRIHPRDTRRVERALEVHALTGQTISSLQTQWTSTTRRHGGRFIGLRWEKSAHHRRINARVKRMIEAGLVDEVRSLRAEPKPLSRQAAQAVGYAEIIAYLAGEMDLEQAVERIKINSRRLAKQQRTWFRRFPDVEWIDLNESSSAQEVAEQLIASSR